MDIRDAFFSEVHRRVLEDERYIVLTDDQGAYALDLIRKERPLQYINCGIAEQNILNVAAGLAMDGFRPVVCGITNFISMRCAEQISVNIAANNLPVTIVASGGGLTYASDGPTHHGTQDVAVMCSMPHFEVYNPADAKSTTYLAKRALTAAFPSYVRIEKGVLPALYNEENLTSGFGVLREGEDVVILSTGIMSHVAIEAAGMLRACGTRAKVIDVFQLKPLPADALLAEIGPVSRVAVLEEQSSFGGLGMQFCSAMATRGVAKQVSLHNLPDKPCYRYGAREWLHQQLGCDARAICEQLTSTFAGCAKA
jgi:transketolase